MGKVVGKITEADGFVPNSYGRSLLEKQTHTESACSSRVTKVLNYGAYEMFRQLDPMVEISLKEFFPDCFREIRTIALLRLVDGVGPRLFHPFFLDSYFSELSPELLMSDLPVRRFVAQLGRLTSVVEEFMRSSILPEAKLVFLTEHISLLLSEMHFLKKDTIPAAGPRRRFASCT